jgi:hypothetical protein
MTERGSMRVSWDDVKQDVKGLNPSLHQLIENDTNLVPSELSILSYSYGSQVGDESYFYFPDFQKSPTMPFSMVYKNNFEMYMEFNGRTSPWKIYKPGQVFPYTKFLKNNYLYEPSDILKMTAGIRNSFLLMNKFSDKRRHAWLQKKYNLSCPVPNSFDEQFLVFKQISDHINPPWRAKLLVFPEAWEEKAYKSPMFVDYLNSVANNDHIFKRNILLYDYLLNSINLDHKITSNAFVREVIRYLFFVACGDQPAYLPTSNESNAPISLLREAYIEVFKSEAIPIFMTPHKLSPFESNETVYYSLNKEDFLFKPNQISNLNKLSFDIKSAFENTCEKIGSSKVAVNTILNKCVTNLSINLIHRWNINSSSENNQEELFYAKDSYLMHEIGEYKNLEFPLNSLFLSGCFSISYKKNYKVLNT